MKIKIVDDLGPEDVAMVQALYSRSAASVDDHLAKAKASGSERMWSQYVVGYGHRSIADCGSTTIFIEGVSLLAAKAIQDHPLYSGQETSTRYIDMAHQPIILLGAAADAKLASDGQWVATKWMNFYTKNQERVMVHVAKMHPRKDGEDEAVYNRAVKARTFDIMRGFLPAGITTQLSWHTNLRQAGDHLTHLDNHPSSEIREIAKAIRKALTEKYPSSGFDRSLASVSGVDNKSQEEAEARAAWEANAGKLTYGRSTTEVGFGCHVELMGLYGTPSWALLRDRPRGCVVPHYFSAVGYLSWEFLLDFGSFRDLQRHRNGVCRMPLLTTSLGFEPWYLDQLDEELRAEARKLIEDQVEAIAALSNDHCVRQYYTALGFRVGCEVAYGLPAAIYLMEMRSAKTVHPTLRRVVLEQMVPKFRAWFPGVALHIDESPDYWTVHRGRQTIEERPRGPLLGEFTPEVTGPLGDKVG